MATIYISSTRALESTNLTYRKSKLGATTLTGVVYKCKGYEVIYKDESKINQLVDMSNQIYGATVSITMDEYTAKEVSEAVEKYFAKKAARGIHELKAGIIVKCNQIKLIDGTHPTLGTATKTLLLNDIDFVEVETPEELVLDASVFIEDTATAVEKTIANSALSLAAKLKQKAESMLMGAANEGLQDLKAAAKKKKTTV